MTNAETVREILPADKTDQKAGTKVTGDLFGTGENPVSFNRYKDNFFTDKKQDLANSVNVLFDGLRNIPQFAKVLGERSVSVQPQPIDNLTKARNEVNKSVANAGLVPGLAAVARPAVPREMPTGDAARQAMIDSYQTGATNTQKDRPINVTVPPVNGTIDIRIKMDDNLKNTVSAIVDAKLGQLKSKTLTGGR
jgi:hypothetical protein